MLFQVGTRSFCFKIFYDVSRSSYINSCWNMWPVMKKKINFHEGRSVKTKMTMWHYIIYTKFGSYSYIHSHQPGWWQRVLWIITVSSLGKVHTTIEAFICFQWSVNYDSSFTIVRFYRCHIWCRLFVPEFVLHSIVPSLSLQSLSCFSCLFQCPCWPAWLGNN